MDDDWEILVGGWALPLWKIWKSVGMMTFPAEWNIIHSCSKPPTRVSNISEFHGYPQSIPMIATLYPLYLHGCRIIWQRFCAGSPRWRCSCSLASASCHPWSNYGDGFPGEQRGNRWDGPWGCGFFFMLVTISPRALLQRFLAKGTWKPQHLIKFKGWCGWYNYERSDNENWVQLSDANNIICFFF